MCLPVLAVSVCLSSPEPPLGNQVQICFSCHTGHGRSVPSLRVVSFFALWFLVPRLLSLRFRGSLDSEQFLALILRCFPAVLRLQLLSSLTSRLFFLCFVCWCGHTLSKVPSPSGSTEGL